MLRHLLSKLPADRNGRMAIAVLALLFLAGGGLRALLLSADRPAFLGYADSQSYLNAAKGPLFGDPLRPAGYPAFLRALHFVSPALTFTTLVQAGLGLASAALLYLATRRCGVGRWWALVPAGAILLSGPQIFIEHALLTESLFVFLQAALLYVAIRALDGGRWAWPATAGAIVGLITTVRTLGLLLAAAIAGWLLLASGAHGRRRLTATLVAAAAMALVLIPYVAAQHSETGYTGLTRAGGWNLYGRAGPFADCGRFTPPAGTRRLCESEPAGMRPGPNAYIFEAKRSPAQQAFGDPFSATQREDDLVGEFARAALLHQPLDWLEQVVTEELPRFVSSSWTARQAEGLSFDGLHQTLLEGPLAGQTSMLASQWYETQGHFVSRGRLDALSSYERITRVVGPLFVALVLLLLAGLLLARGRARRGAMLFALVGAVAAIGPAATLYYDARYAIPAFGPLAAAAGVGGNSLSARLRTARARRGPRPGRRSRTQAPEKT